MVKGVCYPLSIVLFLSLSTLQLRAVGGGVELDSRVDWSSGVLNMVITAPLEAADGILPRERFSLQKRLETEFPHYLYQALNPVRIDSLRTFEETIPVEPELAEAVERLAKESSPKLQYLTEDLKFLRLSYEIELFPGVIEPLLPKDYVTPLLRNPGYEPSGNFTGVVVYAADTIPVHGARNSRGEQLHARLLPCVLPEIYDEEMNLIFAADNVEPSFVRAWGPVHYVTSTELEARDYRTGNYPLYTLAVGLYGTTATNIIIPTEVARQITSREETRQLLREGRITIIVAR